MGGGDTPEAQGFEIFQKFLEIFQNFSKFFGRFQNYSEVLELAVVAHIVLIVKAL